MKKQMLGILAVAAIVQVTGVQVCRAADVQTEAQMQQQRDQRVEAAYGAGDAQTAVNKVQQTGLMNPYLDGKFHPERIMTRAELAMILDKTFKLSERQPTVGGNLMLKDVPANYWAASAINDVVTRGVMQGYHNNGYFYPEQRVSRAEALAIFGQAYGVQQYNDETVSSILSQYRDAQSVPGWARKAMATSLKNGFVEVQPTAAIRPMQPMTRGDMAYALSQYLDRLNQSEQQTLH